MRIVIACDKFKGSLSAGEACAALRAGLEDGGLGAEIVECPIADGGEGFAAAMRQALGGEWVSCPARDALGREIEARYALCRGGDERLAVIEMAEAAGMWRLDPAERDPLRASTFGVGQMIRHAAGEAAAQRVLVGLGGSVTNDGGAGMAAALGASFVDARGGSLQPLPGGLAGLAGVQLADLVSLPPIEVACDVDNPLLGERGATAVFGPQKGAGPREREVLEAFLGRLVEVLEAGEIAARPGAGAAGGLGFGMMAFAGAVLRPGFEMVAAALGLRSRLATADLVVTGEGAIDAQSLAGKGPVGVARLAREVGARVVGVGGRVSGEIHTADLFDRIESLEGYGLDEAESMKRAAELLQETGRRLAAWLGGES